MKRLATGPEAGWTAEIQSAEKAGQPFSRTKERRSRQAVRWVRGNGDGR